MSGSKASEQRSPRCRWPISEKRRIVELTLREGVSVGAIAREHGVHPTSLSHWKTLYRTGKLNAQLPEAPGARARASSARFLPVTIAPALEAPQRSSGVGSPSIVRLTLSSGATLSIESETLDAALVCALIAQVQR